MRRFPAVPSSNQRYRRVLGKVDAADALAGRWSVADNPPTMTTDQTDQTDRPPAGHEPLTIEDAARRLGISVNAVHQRRKRGTLHGRRVAGKWVVYVPPVGATDQRPTSGRSVATSENRPTDRAESVAGVGELVALVDRLVRENVALASTAATLAERNRVLGERLAVLEAGTVAQDSATTPETPPGATEATPSLNSALASSGGVLRRLRRLLGG